MRSVRWAQHTNAPSLRRRSERSRGHDRHTSTSIDPDHGQSTLDSLMANRGTATSPLWTEYSARPDLVKAGHVVEGSIRRVGTMCDGPRLGHGETLKEKRRIHVEINTGIAEPARREIADGLAALLADTYTLYLKTHIYHWNVTGHLFNSLHLMFEGQYLELRDAVDEVAERIRALGHLAPLGYADFVRLSTIPDDTDAPEALEMVRRLAAGHEAVVRTARQVVAVAEDAGDVASVDLATQRINIHEKTAWMLRSTVE